MNEELIVLVLITLAAALVNGALGHGFSSLTVPVALLFYTNRLLNPALVLLEVGINTYVTFMNRSSLPRVWRRAVPIVLGLVPGVIIGAFLLSTVNAEWLKLFVYGVLLPLILLQAAGVRRPVKLTPTVGMPFGTALGVLYSLTTVSGPPLALLFNNQGVVKQEFRVSLGIIRLAESVLTAIAYYHLRLYTAASLQLLGVGGAECGHRGPDRRGIDPANRCRSLSAIVHELRRLDRRIRSLQGSRSPRPRRQPLGLPDLASGCNVRFSLAHRLLQRAPLRPSTHSRLGH